MTRTQIRRAYPGGIHGALSDAGVGDQEDNTCRNGTPRCPGPNADVPALPCAACFLEETDDQDDREDRELIADGGHLIRGYYDVEWIDCIRCRGTGEHVECFDDICHGKGRCIHGNNTCNLCEGLGRISKELADRWRQLDAFEGVTAPDADLHARGKLHAAARERHNRGGDH